MAKKENKITLENLKEKSKKTLQVFNDENVVITDDTIHKETLSTTDGYKNIAPSATQYRGFVTWWVLRNGGNKFKFPVGWINQSVTEVSENIISQQKYV